VNGFDTGILEWLNQFAREWPTFDEGVVLLTNIELPKGGVVIGAFWWAWFRDRSSGRQARSMIVTAIVAAVVAIVVGRLLAHALPFRARPFNTEDFSFTLPATADPDFFSELSSFPSDHAVMFSALAMSMFFIWRPMGIAIAVYSFMFIFLPRLYVGLHWPTDIIAGALLGAAIAWAAMLPWVRKLCSDPAFWILDRRPGFFYAGAFLLTYEIAELFDDLRRSGGLLADALGLS
jgi:undecaprenyl-diphosphatase